MTQLGVVWNMDLNNARQLEELSSKLKDLGGRIVRHNGRIGDKIMALEYCLRSTIAYRMQFCVWGLEEYEKLDKTYASIVKAITRNLKGYPTRPLWALSVDGGLGIQSLLDYTQRCKLRLLLRNIDKHDTAGKAFGLPVLCAVLEQAVLDGVSKRFDATLANRLG
jgi:hypothetical protein